MTDRVMEFDELISSGVTTVRALTENGWRLRSTDSVAQAVFMGACLLRRKSYAFDNCVYTRAEIQGDQVYIRWDNPVDKLSFCTSYTLATGMVHFQFWTEGIKIMEEQIDSKR